MPACWVAPKYYRINEYDKVFPMDIFPEQLIKATLAFNIEKMERLGIYEVAPEDFASASSWIPRSWNCSALSVPGSTCFAGGRVGLPIRTR